MLRANYQNYDQSVAKTQAMRQLKDKLKSDEIKALSGYLDKFVELGDSLSNQLINTIQNCRIYAEEDLDFGSGTCDSNYFVENLKTLLDNGTALEDFAHMTPLDQEGFALQANFICLLMRNGIEFKKLSKISASELAGFRDFLTTSQNLSKYELLHSKEASSAKKAEAVEFVNGEINSILHSRSDKLKN